MIEIINALSASGINAVLVDQTDISTIDTGEGLYSALKPLVSDRVYPLKLPDTPVLPSMVYQPVGRDWVEIDGQRIGRTDRYLISARDKTFAGLSALSNAISTVIAGFVGQSEITDAAADYEEKQRQYRAHFEVDITTLASASQSLPAAFVYSINADAGENQADNRIRQQVVEGICIVLVCQQDQLLTNRKTLENALVGLSIDPAGDVVEYAGGKLLDQSGSVTYWRELFSYTRYLRT